MNTPVTMAMNADELTAFGKLIASSAPGIVHMVYFSTVKPVEMHAVYVNAFSDIVRRMKQAEASTIEQNIAALALHQLTSIVPTEFEAHHLKTENTHRVLVPLMIHAEHRHKPRSVLLTALQYRDEIDQSIFGYWEIFEAPFEALTEAVQSLRSYQGSYNRIAPTMQTEGKAPLPFHALLRTSRPAQPLKQQALNKIYLAFLADFAGPNARNSLRQFVANMFANRLVISDLDASKFSPNDFTAICSIFNQVKATAASNKTQRGTCKNAIVIYDDYIVDYAAHGSLIAIQNLVASMITNGISLDALDPTKFYPQHWEIICSEYQEKSI